MVRSGRCVVILRSSNGEAGRHRGRETGALRRLGRLVLVVHWRPPGVLSQKPPALHDGAHLGKALTRKAGVSSPSGAGLSRGLGLKSLPAPQRVSAPKIAVLSPISNCPSLARRQRPGAGGSGTAARIAAFRGRVASGSHAVARRKRGLGSGRWEEDWNAPSSPRAWRLPGRSGQEPAGR